MVLNRGLTSTVNMNGFVLTPVKVSGPSGKVSVPFGKPRTQHAFKIGQPFNKLSKRRRAKIVAVKASGDKSVIPDLEFGDLVSDSTHVILDSSQVNSLLDKLNDDDHDVLLDEQFYNLGEDLSNKIDKEKQKSVQTESEDEQKENTTEASNEKNDMVYFCNENLPHMPSWIQQMYLNGEHTDLEKGAEIVVNQHRLHDIVARKPAMKEKDVTHGDGIVDCAVGDVAVDYSIPPEFVVDAMLAFGVPSPIKLSASIRDSMTSEEIQRLLKLITSFDTTDLADRYSDRSLVEVAEDYDVDVKALVKVCKMERLYLCLGENTHLSNVREDRVLEILLKGHAMNLPYPSLLEGLE